MKTYEPKKIETAWQKRWQESDVFKAVEDSSQPKKYILDMFPYPSGDGLHIGHAKLYIGSDIVARYWRMKGYRVLYPTGWDAFGLPAENSAIKFGIHPAELTRKNIDRFRQQMKMLGLSYDWSREINTTDPKYYKWTQWVFLQLFKKGLAYQATVSINWCPSCLTGLANEEVIDGACERCGTLVVRKPMRQWLLRITDYADRLLAGLEQLDWPKFIIELQRNWIGKSHGLEEEWAVAEMDIKLKTFTTWPHTTWGTTFMVVAPEHPIIDELVRGTDYEAGAKKFREKTIQDKIKDPNNVDKKKEGFFLGRYAVNHLSGQRLPLYSANFAIYEYGTGIVKCTPAHDQRDFEFAKKYNLAIKPVIKPTDGQALDPQTMTEAYTSEGTMMNAEHFDGLPTEQARQAIGDYSIQQGSARWTVNYKLRDWVFSRQRYWGEPIPIIHCSDCGIVPVSEEDLPIELPPVENYQPTGTGESPLATIDEWVNVSCPRCSGGAKRETNTMPQWAGSSWYWLRYADPNNDEALAAADHLRAWLPVDMYIGGAEHAVLHLLYARFWNMVLFDLGIVPEAEPFLRLRNVGLMLGLDGQKMSKSRGNVIRPDEVVEQFGTDTVRVYEMFMGPFEGSAAWSQQGIEGAQRFLQRVWAFIHTHADTDKNETEADNGMVEVQRAIQRITRSAEELHFNTAISALMELLNFLEKQAVVPRSVLETYITLLAPFAPHLSEELWRLFGHDSLVARGPWPVLDESILARATISLPVQVNGRLRGTITISPGQDQTSIEEQARQLPNVQRHLQERSVQKVVYVGDRLLNFVLK